LAARFLALDPERLNCSPEAARALVKRLHLPRQKANDGKVLVSVDLSEINHKPLPARSPGDHHPVTARLKASIEVLQMELAKSKPWRPATARTSSASASVPMRSWPSC
jgi:hypothetical protein